MLNPMHIILLSNLCIFNFFNTNNNDNNDHNLMNHNDEKALENLNDFQNLRYFCYKITDTYKYNNSRKFKKVTKSNPFIENETLLFKKPKLIYNDQMCKTDNVTITNQLLQNGSVTSKQTNDDNLKIQKELLNDHRPKESQIINASNNKKEKEKFESQITQHIYSRNFTNLFKIIENDLIACLKYGCLYLFDDDKKIDEIILLLKEKTDINTKIINLDKNLKYLLEKDLKYKLPLSSEKFLSIKSILNKAKYKNTEYSRVCEKKASLIKSLNKSIIRNEIDFNDIFNATFLLLQKINDDNIRQLCTMGLQNLYNKERHGTTPKFFDTLILLYLYKYKRQHFNLDWSDYFFKLLSSQYRCYVNLIYFNKIKDWVSKVDERLVFYRKCIIMNSKFIDISMDIYDELSQNQSELNLIHHLIDKLNLVKSKIYKINEI